MDLRKRAFFYFIFITILVINLGAAEKLTEDYTVKTALSNNPGLISYEKMKNAASAKRFASFWLPNPTLGIENMNGADGLFSTGITKLTIGQKIPFPVKQGFKAAAAVENSNKAGYMYEKMKWNTEKTVRTKYYELYAVNRTINVMEENVQLVKQLSRIASSKYATGAASQQDVLKAEVEYARLQNELITLKQNREIIIASLESIMGVNENIDKDSGVEKPGYPVLNAGFEDISKMVKEAPSVKAAKAEKNKSGHMRSAALSSYIPDLNFKYKKHLDSTQNAYDVMFEISVPLWFITNNQAEVNMNTELADSKDKEYRDVYNRAAAEAKEHFEVVKSTGRLVKLYESTLIPQAETALRSGQSAYQSGQVEFINILDSERTLLNFRIEYYNKYAEYLKHYRMLEALLGRELGTLRQAQGAERNLEQKNTTNIEGGDNE